MPGCAEVCDKVARIFQNLKAYEMASSYFQVNLFSLKHARWVLSLGIYCCD